MTDVLMQIDHLSKSFGGVKAVVDFSMVLEKNQVVGIIGPNGAGKTTIFNLISNVYTPDQGTIIVEGKDITRLSQIMKARQGIGRTFQNIRLFSTLSVLDNVKVACDYKAKCSMIESIIRFPRSFKSERKIRDEAMECLELVGLAHLANEKPGNLPYGLQRRLEIARALVMRPKVLMLDEPAAGLNPEECFELVDFLKEILVKFDTSLIIIEHRMDVVMNLCHKIYVQDFGKNIACGTPAEIQCDPAVLSAYLGEESQDETT